MNPENGDGLADDVKATADFLAALQGVLGLALVPQGLLAYLDEAGRSEAHQAVLRVALEARQVPQQVPARAQGGRR